MIVAQVALASVLLLAAGLLLHSFIRLRAVNPGFDPERILGVSVSPSAPAGDSLRRVEFFDNAAASGPGMNVSRKALAPRGLGVHRKKLIYDSRERPS
jgi:hypothetical protein